MATTQTAVTELERVKVGEGSYALVRPDYGWELGAIDRLGGAYWWTLDFPAQRFHGQAATLAEATADAGRWYAEYAADGGDPTPASPDDYEALV